MEVLWNEAYAVDPLGDGMVLLRSKEHEDLINMAQLSGTRGKRRDRTQPRMVVLASRVRAHSGGTMGGLYDPDTGLVEFGCRWYDAETGRWISKDPILLDGGWNVYAFCDNDPVNHTDPSGLTIVWDTKPFSGSRPIGIIPGESIMHHWRWVDDGQDGIVRLRRRSAKYLDLQLRKIANRLHQYANDGWGMKIWHEATFDTDSFEGPYKQHQYFSIDGHDGLWSGNEVNYIGIGMYEAWLNHSMEWAETITALWKLQYFSPPSVGTYYWLKYGYNQFRPYYGEK